MLQQDIFYERRTYFHNIDTIYDLLLTIINTLIYFLCCRISLLNLRRKLQRC